MQLLFDAVMQSILIVNGIGDYFAELISSDVQETITSCTIVVGRYPFRVLCFCF